MMWIEVFGEGLPKKWFNSRSVALSLGERVIEYFSLNVQEDPYVMVRSAELEGYCIDLLKALAAMLHFSYKVKVVGDGQYGAVSPTGNWTGMIGEILRQVIFNLYF